MIYLDSSAVLKLLFQEKESDALAEWLSARTDLPTVSSELIKVEVVRAARRLDPRVVPAARVLVAQLDLIPLSGPLLEAACETGTPLLRALDAIHLASALVIRDELTAFLAYDHRLFAAAEVAGLHPTSPN